MAPARPQGGPVREATDPVPRTTDLDNVSDQSIQPPPTTRSPSYITKAWPGATACCGTSNSSLTRSPSSAAAVAGASGCLWRIWAVTLISPAGGEPAIQFTPEAL